MGELTGYMTRKTTNQEILHKIQILIHFQKLIRLHMHLQNTNRTEKTKTEMDKLHITKKSNFVIIRLPTVLAFTFFH